MIDFSQVTDWFDRSHLVVTLSASTMAVVLIAMVFRSRTKVLDLAATVRRRRFSAGTVAAVVAFIICTSVSLNTSYRFTGDPDGLHMTSETERLLACAAFESLLAMCVLGARERLADTGSRSGGWYSSAVWVFAALSAVPAWQEGDGFSAATAVRIIVGSFGSALAAHSALGLELRHRTGDESQTAMAQIARDLRERLMATLGLAHRSRSAEEIARDRALDKAVDLNDKYIRLPDGTKSGRKGRRIARRLAVWQDRAQLATDSKQRELYRSRVAQRKHATSLHITDAESPWSQPSPAQAKANALGAMETHARHMEGVAAEVEAALMAQIGTPAAAQGGTSVPVARAEAAPEPESEPAEPVEAPAAPSPRAAAAQGGTSVPVARAEAAPEPESEPAEPVEAPAAPSPRAAAAHSGVPAIVTARVPHYSEYEDEETLPPLLPLASYPTKRAALEALYAHRITSADLRKSSTNAIAEKLREEMATAGIELDRGPANRYVRALREGPKQGARRLARV